MMSALTLRTTTPLSFRARSAPPTPPFSPAAIDASDLPCCCRCCCRCCCCSWPRDPWCCCCCRRRRRCCCCWLGVGERLAGVEEELVLAWRRRWGGRVLFFGFKKCHSEKQFQWFLLPGVVREVPVAVEHVNDVVSRIHGLMGVVRGDAYQDGVGTGAMRGLGRDVVLENCCSSAGRRERWRARVEGGRSGSGGHLTTETLT